MWPNVVGSIRASFAEPCIWLRTYVVVRARPFLGKAGGHFELRIRRENWWGGQSQAGFGGGWQLPCQKVPFPSHFLWPLGDRQKPKFRSGKGDLDCETLWHPFLPRGALPFLLEPEREGSQGHWYILHNSRCLPLHSSGMEVFSFSDRCFRPGSISQAVPSDMK